MTRDGFCLTGPHCPLATDLCYMRVSGVTQNYENALRVKLEINHTLGRGGS